MSFSVDHLHAEAATARLADRGYWPDVPTVTWCSVARPTLVLGSSQPLAIVDAAAAAAGGVAVCRRVSGGGAVLLRPDESVWAEIVVPAGDRRWDDDVVRAAQWVGDAWIRALVGLRIEAHRLVRHDGGLVATQWSRRVCFAALGPGELSLDGRKVAGISQRRARQGARFQVAVLRRWDPVGILALLDLDETTRRNGVVELADVAVGLDFSAAALRDAFVDALR